MQVGLNGFEFWRNSTRISDILARRELVSKALNKVQVLLEVTYPLAFEVYRDENGSFFLIPDIGKDNRHEFARINDPVCQVPAIQYDFKFFQGSAAAKAEFFCDHASESSQGRQGISSGLFFCSGNDGGGVV